MTEFSAKERMIAAMLSSMPRVKNKIKNIYILINSIIYRKNYKLKILDPRIGEVKHIGPESGKIEVFFGYYDKCCCFNDRVVVHCQRNLPSTQLPNPSQPIELLMSPLNSNTIGKIGETAAYNWQQGSRLHWISEDKILYNVFDDSCNSYKTVLYSVFENKIIKFYDKPVQESFHDKFFLSINYTRLWNMRPDYCYRCIPKLSKKQLKEMDDDGIWFVDMNTGQNHLIHSINQVLKIDYKNQFEKCDHNVNHVMLSPNGKRFIFIHRNYLNQRRFDRLMLSDFEKLNVIIDEGCVSHCCWIDDNTILGYLRSGGVKGFYYINVDTLAVKCCEAISSLHTGDGHPSFNGRFVAFDTYPDKSRMQKLYLYDIAENIVIPVVELFQNIKYKNETRCDLHPRFSNDGRLLFFDSVYSGQRTLNYIDLTPFYRNY